MSTPGVSKSQNEVAAYPVQYLYRRTLVVCILRGESFSDTCVLDFETVVGGGDGGRGCEYLSDETETRGDADTL